MIKSYESSLVGIPFLQKMCQPICLQESHKELTSNISFNFAFLLCSRFWRITRKAISALCYPLTNNVRSEMWHFPREYDSSLSNSRLTTVSAHNSRLDIDELSPCPPTGTLPPLPQCVVTRLQRKCTHTQNSKARPGLVLLYLNPNIGISIEDSLDTLVVVEAIGLFRCQYWRMLSGCVMTCVSLWRLGEPNKGREALRTATGCCEDSFIIIHWPFM